MLSADRITEFFELLSHIETRDKGAFSLRDYLVSKAIDKNTANNISTILHQLHLYISMPYHEHFKLLIAEAVSIIQGNDKLFYILDTYSRQVKSRSLSE
jgi:hypothetical protein